MKKYFVVSLAALAFSAVTSNAMALNLQFRPVRLNGIAAGNMTSLALATIPPAPPVPPIVPARCTYALVWYDQFNTALATSCGVTETPTIQAQSCGVNASMNVPAFVTNDNVALVGFAPNPVGVGVNCAGFDNFHFPRAIAPNGLNLFEALPPSPALNGFVTYLALGPFMQSITVA